MKNRWPLHLLLLCLLTVGVSLLFLQEPGFGDDLTYWVFGYDLHESGLQVWQAKSFHNLRWPVWGVCWLLQGLGLKGYASYAGAPIVYLAAGVACAFAFGRLLSRSLGFAWAAGLAFLFCPVIDLVCHRPMPDLSEGVLGAATLLAWWRLMRAESHGHSLGWAALVGLGVFLTESNRLTGVFIVAVLFAGTVIYARRRFGWLVAAGGFALLFYVAEAAFYHQLFGDWLHNLHANLEGKGRKGTANISFWTSPFRFLDSLWHENHLSPVYSILGLVGLWSIFIRHRRTATLEPQEVTRSAVHIPAEGLVVLWFFVIYLGYACGPQSLHPWQPVVRDGSRFLGTLAVPLSLLAVLGLRYLLDLPQMRARHWGRWIPEHPVLVGAAAVVVLCGSTSRHYYDLGYLPQLRAYVRHVPTDTKIFTLHTMRALAIMAAPESATRLQWNAPKDLLMRTGPSETAAAWADEFWYLRKIAWMNTRKRLEDKRTTTKFPFGSYLESPARHWALAKVLVHGDTPDLVFYRRRTPAMPLPVVLTEQSPEFANLLPTLPVDWQPVQDRLKTTWAVPPSFRGKCLQIHLEATANEVEAAGVTLTFSPNHNRYPKQDFLMKPYTFPTVASDFFVIPIPEEATECTISVRLNHSTKRLQLVSFRALLEAPLDGLP